MLAAYFRKTGELSLEEVPAPEPEANQVQVQMKINTICGGTDSEILSGVRPYPKDIILGHEGGGVVTKVGSRTKKLKPGMRVASEAWGGYAGYVADVEDMFQPVPDSMSWEEISLAEITLKCWQMAARNIKPGDTVVVLGQGAAGLIFTQLAKIMGASCIVVTDLYDFKLKKALAYGAQSAFNGTETDLAAKVMQATGGQGADVVIEATGRKAGVELAPHVTKRYGALILQFGVVAENATYNFKTTHDKGQSILTIGACRFPDPTEPLRASVRLIAEKKIEVASFITHRFPLAKINQAFQLLREHPEQVLKVAIDI